MITREDIIHYLSGTADEELFALSGHAKQSTVGQKVYLRGLVELSNRCDKNCYYCGIRHANLSVERYTLLAQDVLQAAQYALSQGYGSLVLQAGERRDEHFIAFVEELLHSISQLGDRALGVTLSIGEQSAATFARWRNAGAKRYLLRMESFNRELYATLHPAGHSWSQRRACLDLLREADYQVGTGVMIGLPGQSLGDLADDLLSMVALDIDMCGMGPYVEHSAAPLSVHASPYAVKE
ncbi:MAG: radical SAM protein, partial [Mucinivorans sp.]